MPVYYNVKKENRTVNAYLVIKGSDGSVTFEGTAKCNPTDTWDEEFGKKLARQRALLKFKKAELAGTALMCEKYLPAHEQYEKYFNKLVHVSGVVERLKEEIKRPQ